jgi:membrane-anchored protein YejM (alkaline phosphatase superfamily)
VLALTRARGRWPRLTFLFLLALTCTMQVYLYALNLVSNVSWGRNMTGHIVVAFAPTVWSEREPFPVGPVGITAFAVATFAAIMVGLNLLGRRFGPVLGLKAADTMNIALHPWRPRLLRVGAGVLAITLFGATITFGVESRDNLFWKQELVSSFFRPEGFAFEPTARREAMADRDATLRATYPRAVPTAYRKNVVLIIVDSLRADRMQVYGYKRPTTPFLSELVQSGRMKKIEDAFSSCSESFCGITSTLASREFRDITARNFQLQDVLRDQGYQTQFVLSGDHRIWNGLPQFYHVGDEAIFDGSQTRRYSMDDDRLVLEGLERVPAANPEQPTLFYLHLMSTHYLGVQFPESHVFTRLDDQVSPGIEPYKILEKLEKPDRYDDKVLQADGLIRQIFAALDAKHYLDEAIVVVTGDHGEGLGERHWAHGWHLYNEDIRIPLLFYDAPASPTKTYPDLTFGTQVDIAPTILDRVGLPIPESWEGQSLLAPTAERFTYHQTYFLPNRFAVIYRDGDKLFKFIATPQYGKEELYDLRKDAKEAHSLVDEQRQLAALLRDKVRSYLAE